MTLRGLRAVQDKTKNGSVLQEHDRSHRKELNKLEHQMQMAKVKLSVARNENTALKTKVMGLRREKFLHLQISHDLVRSSFLPSFLQQPYYPSLLPITLPPIPSLPSNYDAFSTNSSLLCSSLLCSNKRLRRPARV